jgi:LysM domain
MLHVVKSGESWLKIANDYGVTVAALVAANPPATTATWLFVGDQLNVPMVESSVAVVRRTTYDIVVKQGTKTTTLSLSDDVMRELTQALRGVPDTRDDVLIVRKPV